MSKPHSHLINIQKHFIIGILLLSIIIIGLFVEPFLSAVFIAAVIATAVYPIKDYFHIKKRIEKNISAILTLLLAMILVIIPLTGIFLFIGNEASDAYLYSRDRINEVVLSQNNPNELLNKLPIPPEMLRKFSEMTPVTTEDLVGAIANYIKVISTFLLEQSANLLKHLSMFVLDTLIFLIALFYFIRDGKEIIQALKSYLPLPKKHQDELFEKLRVLMNSIIFGLFGVALIQGGLVAIGFTIVGVQNAAFWGAVAALFSPVPYIGTTVVWIPVVIYLLILGKWGAAIFLFLWSAAIVGTADNIIKPYIIGAKAAMNPLALLLVMLGGAISFGINGLIFGPFLLTILIAFLHIYKLEYKNILPKK